MTFLEALREAKRTGWHMKRPNAGWRYSLWYDLTFGIANHGGGGRGTSGLSIDDFEAHDWELVEPLPSDVQPNDWKPRP